jgi:hypothetical protein
MERVKEEMRKFREKQKEDARLGRGPSGPPHPSSDAYLVYPYTEGGEVVMQKPRIVLIDLGRNNNSLSSVERDSLEKILVRLRGNEDHKKSDTGASQEKDAEATEPAAPTLSTEDEEELDRLWALLSRPEISETEETDVFKGLIQKQRVDLVKVLVGRVAEVKGMGQSKLFGVLCTRYVGERKYKEENPVTTSKEVFVEKPPPPPAIVLSSEDEAELGQHWEALKRPELTEAEETDIFKTLIQQQKTDLVKVLVGRVAETRGLGKSRLFAVLCQRYVGERRYKEEQASTPVIAVNGTASLRESLEMEGGKGMRRESQDSVGGKSRHSDDSRSRHNSGGEKSSRSRHTSVAERSRHSSGAERSRHSSGAEKSSRSRHASGADNSIRSSKERSRHPTGESTAQEPRSRHSTVDGRPDRERNENSKHTEGDLEDVKGKGDRKVMLENIKTKDENGGAVRKSSESDKENQEKDSVAPVSVSASVKRPSNAEMEEPPGKRSKTELKENKRGREAVLRTVVMENSNMGLDELRQQLKLKHLNVCVRLKNFRLVYRAHVAHLAKMAAAASEKQKDANADTPVLEHGQASKSENNSLNAKEGAEGKESLKLTASQESPADSASRSPSPRSKISISRSRSPASNHVSRSSTSRSKSRSRSRSRSRQRSGSNLRSKSRSRSRSASR